MSTDPTTPKLAAQLQHLAIEVDEITRHLVARDDLTSGRVSLALYLLAGAVDELNAALYVHEEVFDVRVQAEYLETTRILADPPPGVTWETVSERSNVREELKRVTIALGDHLRGL